MFTDITESTRNLENLLENISFLANISIHQHGLKLTMRVLLKTYNLIGG